MSKTFIEGAETRLAAPADMPAANTGVEMGPWLQDVCAHVESQIVRAGYVTAEGDAGTSRVTPLLGSFTVARAIRDTLTERGRQPELPIIALAGFAQPVIRQAVERLRLDQPDPPAEKAQSTLAKLEKIAGLQRPPLPYRLIAGWALRKQRAAFEESIFGTR